MDFVLNNLYFCAIRRNLLKKIITNDRNVELTVFSFVERMKNKQL